jgi:hypothetical protein
MDQIPLPAGYAAFVNENTSVADRSGASSSAAWTPAISVLPTRYSDSSAPRPESVLPQSFGSTSEPKFVSAGVHSVLQAASIRLTDAL